MAVEMYKEVDSEVVSAKDTIIDDLIDIVQSEDPDITFEQATETAIAMFEDMVESGSLVKLTPAVNKYMEVDSEIVSTRDEIIDNLIDVVQSEDPDITRTKATELANERCKDMVASGMLVKVEYDEYE